MPQTNTSDPLELPFGQCDVMVLWSSHNWKLLGGTDRCPMGGFNSQPWVLSIGLFGNATDVEPVDEKLTSLNPNWTD